MAENVIFKSSTQKICDHRVFRNQRWECDLTREMVCPEAYIPNFKKELCYFLKSK